MTNVLDELISQRKTGAKAGITSVTSAHPVVLRATIRFGVEHESAVMIEATSNQVNHQGGYTGMRPADFRDLVFSIADDEGLPRERLHLGGDHLGPNPWRHLPAAEAMAEATLMVREYVAAGFNKIHLDTSMGCKGEPVALDDETTATRAVHLAIATEATAREHGMELPRYIVGTEVPPPGGADHVLDTVTPTDPDAARKTIAVHQEKFLAADLGDAFDRVRGLVVQPGVEFGNHNVIKYARAEAAQLVRVLDDQPNLVFEAHSTDYQGTAALTQLVEDGFAILKVGPEMSFVLREALYALDLIASDLIKGYGERSLKAAMEREMVANPNDWQRHYAGNDAEQAMLRHYSLSDRIRYYWALEAAQIAVENLKEALDGKSIPMPLFMQHLPSAVAFADAPLDFDGLLIWRIQRSIASYHAATI